MHGREAPPRAYLVVDDEQPDRARPLRGDGLLQEVAVPAHDHRDLAAQLWRVGDKRLARGVALEGAPDARRLTFFVV